MGFDIFSLDAAFKEMGTQLGRLNRDIQQSKEREMKLRTSLPEGYVLDIQQDSLGGVTVRDVRWDPQNDPRVAARRAEQDREQQLALERMAESARLNQQTADHNEAMDRWRGLQQSIAQAKADSERLTPSARRARMAGLMAEAGNVLESTGLDERGAVLDLLNASGVSEFERLDGLRRMAGAAIGGSLSVPGLGVNVGSLARLGLEGATDKALQAEQHDFRVAMKTAGLDDATTEALLGDEDMRAILGRVADTGGQLTQADVETLRTGSAAAKMAAAAGDPEVGSRVANALLEMRNPLVQASERRAEEALAIERERLKIAQDRAAKEQSELDKERRSDRLDTETMRTLIRVGAEGTGETAGVTTVTDAQGRQVPSVRVDDVQRGDAPQFGSLVRAFDAIQEEIGDELSPEEVTQRIQDALGVPDRQKALAVAKSTLTRVKKGAGKFKSGDTIVVASRQISSEPERFSLNPFGKGELFPSNPLTAAGVENVIRVHNILDPKNAIESVKLMVRDPGSVFKLREVGTLTFSE